LLEQENRTAYIASREALNKIHNRHMSMRASHRVCCKHFVSHASRVMETWKIKTYLRLLQQVCCLGAHISVQKIPVKLMLIIARRDAFYVLSLASNGGKSATTASYEATVIKSLQVIFYIQTAALLKIRTHLSGFLSGLCRPDLEHACKLCTNGCIDRIQVQRVRIQVQIPRARFDH
jgi:hypothetical protein